MEKSNTLYLLKSDFGIAFCTEEKRVKDLVFKNEKVEYTKHLKDFTEGRVYYTIELENDGREILSPFEVQRMSNKELTEHYRNFFAGELVLYFIFDGIKIPLHKKAIQGNIGISEVYKRQNELYPLAQEHFERVCKLFAVEALKTVGTINIKHF